MIKLGKRHSQVRHGGAPPWLPYLNFQVREILSQGETLRVLPRIWRMQAVSGGIALVISATCFWWAHRFQRAGPKLSLNQVVLILAVTAAFWVLLFWNNAGLMPFYSGFDAQYHVNYIEYVLEHHALPLPTQGFEMYQPPLYYALCAAVSGDRQAHN